MSRLPDGLFVIFEYLKSRYHKLLSTYILFVVIAVAMIVFRHRNLTQGTPSGYLCSTPNGLSAEKCMEDTPLTFLCESIRPGVIPIIFASSVLMFSGYDRAVRGYRVGSKPSHAGFEWGTPLQTTLYAVDDNLLHIFLIQP